MAPVNFSGTWVEIEKEGFDTILETVGLPEEMRLKLADFKIRHVITQTGDVVHVKAFMPGFEQEYTVTADGQERQLPDFLGGKDTKGSAWWEGAKLVMDVDTAGQLGRMERYMEADKMIATAAVDGKLAKIIMVQQ